MSDNYSLSAMNVLKDYFNKVDMPVEIIQDGNGDYHLLQKIQLDDDEQIGVSYTINPDSDSMDETVIVKFTAHFNCQVPEDKINDVLMHLNTLNMHNSIGHYYLLGQLPMQVYEYAVPGETLGEAMTFLEIMFLFGYALIAANDSVVQMINENISIEQAYLEFVGEYSYFLSEESDEDNDDE